MPENYADGYWTTAPASWVWNGNWKNTHTSTGTELPICDPTNAPTETPTQSPVKCTVKYTRHQGMIRQGNWFLSDDDLIPTDPVCLRNDDWTPPFCRDGKFPQGLAIGIDRCKVACAARPKCKAIAMGHPTRGTAAECWLAGEVNDQDNPLMPHGNWDMYDIEEVCEPDSWEYFPNYCASSDNVDLPQSQWISGSNSRDACVSECMANDDCSAIEWYQSGWGGSNCYLMLGDIPSTQGFVGVRWRDAECHVKPLIGAVLKECRWESNHDQNPNSANYMGWTCANDEILTGFGLSADQHDVTKVRCCKVGGHSSIKSNTCTYVESNHERAKCGNGNDHMVFSGAYDKRVAVNDAVTEILAGKCCEVECDAPWCAGGDWGVDKNNCQVISTASTQAQELVCPRGTIMTEVEDGLAGNAHGVQKVASVTCCALDMIAPPTRAPTAPPSTARPTSAPTTAPSTSLPSMAPTTVDDCLLALKERLESSQLTDSQYLSNVDLCLPGCRSPRRALESRQLTGRLLSESNSV